ncbi:MAG: zinc metalloprotease HtpX [Elusimicrobia bacterium RIFOXYA2_FULL_58_8]|nr:MAG: zinc metalloprotease HtpX [Elusimicrobia bacterium RIFOXYA2_FULL_58_8]OGS14174.1 MAG: zinc metalloprotease HtpX [Elusimicrobia bacterium RIFOXYA12_FULL_57_11]
MRFAKRIVLFLAVNILILVTLSFTLNFLGVRPYLSARGMDYNSLMLFCLVWGMGGAFISLGLSRVMAKWMMGVVVVEAGNSDATLSRLVQTVHNLAKAANLPAMPEVGYYSSPEINAFATGPTRSRALVAVSAGLLEAMDWEQIEGVLAHEIAHVANGDMVTMTLVQGIINAFVMFLARVIAFFISSRGRDSDSGSVPNYFLVMALEMALSLLGLIVVSAFSRMREYRADAGGAGLAGREKMISALEGLKKNARYADLTGKESLATLKIAGKPRGFAALFATHPPLEERIARLKAAV